MADERLARVMSSLAARRHQGSVDLCVMAREMVEVTGAGVAVLTETGTHRFTVCSSDAVAGIVEDLQFALGEGPCVDAFLQDRPVAEAELRISGPARWPAFTPPALDAGVAAVFGYPLRVGTTRLGALNLYRNRAGELSSDQHAEALVVADVVARELLSVQAEASPGTLAPELVGDANVRLVVHQASGMVAVQFDVAVDEALVRIRAYAFARGEAVEAIAGRIVERSLVLE